MMATGPSEKKIYLASRSPRRRELLKQIGVPFEVLLLRDHPGRNVDVDESQQPDETPGDYVRRVARLKAEAGWERVLQRRLRRFPVLAADTVVAVEEAILGKPLDPARATEMLKLLSGREHRVLTAVAVKFEDRLELFVSESHVRFAELSQADIDAYVASGESTDKAGAYAIQGRAQAFVTELRGSHSGVMGLPLHETTQLLKTF
jgi:septum formation protein